MNARGKKISNPTYQLTLELSDNEAHFLMFLFRHMDGDGAIDATVGRAFTETLKGLGIEYADACDNYIYQKRSAQYLRPIYYKARN